MIVTVVPDNFSPSVKLSRDQFDLRLIRLNSVGSHGKKKKIQVDGSKAEVPPH